MEKTKEKIEEFFKSEAFGVAGASSNREKYGNKVLRCYKQNHLKITPVHPHEVIVEGIACVKSISDLPKNIKSISIITPPKVTEKIVEEAILHGIKNFWMQPGAESQAAIEMCLQNNCNVIADGSCLLVVLGFKSHENAI
jgi:predicted CoA-binding protein